MDRYSNETYGDRVASVYDAMYADVDSHAIDALAALAQGGKVLELGIGTGRIALPLVEKNIDVQGIDASTSMIERLRARRRSNLYHDR
jgi:ubiquinone/menaquinone biosynthesis C-methylase UbiE